MISMNGMMNSIVISKVKGGCCSNKKSLSIDEMRAELAADADTLPESLFVTARTVDGEVMAVQHKDYPIYGVQFHPESIMTPDGKQMLKNFIKEM